MDSHSNKINDDTIAYYDSHAEEFYARTVNVDMSEIYSQFLVLLPDHARILDAGCGSGRDSLYFLSKGYRVVSFDASAEMVKRSSRLLGIEVLQMCFEDVDLVDEFDAIWACASLLHVPRQGLGMIIKKMETALVKGGILYASFQYGEDERIESSGRFFCYHTERTIKDIVRTSSDLEVIKSWKSEDKRPDRPELQWISLLAKK